jgi:hypothetical protein
MRRGLWQLQDRRKVGGAKARESRPSGGRDSQGPRNAYRATESREWDGRGVEDGVRWLSEVIVAFGPRTIEIVRLLRKPVS